MTLSLSEQTQLGIDEAGRGPVLGPMVLAGLRVDVKEIPLLEKLGVMDSKLLGTSPKKKKERAEIAKRLSTDFNSVVLECPAAMVDEWVRGKSLNQLEVAKAKEIITALPAAETILDGQNLFSPLACTNPWVHAKNKADLDYLVVAGASILAKVKRDQLFEAQIAPFEKNYRGLEGTLQSGKIGGGGYGNAKTLDFVLWHLKEFGRLPDFYRQSYHWKALQAATCGGV